MYIYFVNTNINFINIYNKKDTTLIILRYYYLGTIVEYKAKESYLVKINNYSLIAKSVGENKGLKTLLKYLE